MYTVHMRKEYSVLTYILTGLVPYTDANLKLAYKPHLFFNELDRITEQQKRNKIPRETLRTAYYRALQKGYFAIDQQGKPVLTAKGEERLALFKPTKLKGAKLLVTFGIPEKIRHKRDEFRSLLVTLRFKQEQRSVWISDYDSRKILHTEIIRLQLDNYVVIYEAKDIRTF